MSAQAIWLLSCLIGVGFGIMVAILLHPGGWKRDTTLKLEALQRELEHLRRELRK